MTSIRHARLSPVVPMFVVAAIAIALIGRPGIPVTALFAVVTVAGLCIIDGQPAVNAPAVSALLVYLIRAASTPAAAHQP